MNPTYCARRHLGCAEMNNGQVAYLNPDGEKVFLCQRHLDEQQIEWKHSIYVQIKSLAGPHGFAALAEQGLI